jgi:hypothetical protein
MTTPLAVELRTRNQSARRFAVLLPNYNFSNGYSTVIIRVLSIDDNNLMILAIATYSFRTLERRVFTDPELVPFEPPERPLGLLGLPTLLRNYIETVPRSAYEQSVTQIRTRLSDVLIVSDPQFIQEILVEKAEAFGRDPTTRRSFAPVIGETSLLLPRAPTGAGNGALLLQFSDTRRYSHLSRFSQIWPSARLSAGAPHSVRFRSTPLPR